MEADDEFEEEDEEQGSSLKRISFRMGWDSFLGKKSVSRLL